MDYFGNLDRSRSGARTDSGVVSIVETPGSPGGPGWSGVYWPAYGIYRPLNYGIDSHRPLTTTEKGVLIAATTLVGGPLAILGGGSRAAFLLWKLRPLTIPLLLESTSTSPGGGGPGQSLTSTDTPPSAEEAGLLLSRGYQQHSGR